MQRQSTMRPNNRNRYAAHPVVNKWIALASPSPIRLISDRTHSLLPDPSHTLTDPAYGTLPALRQRTNPPTLPPPPPPPLSHTLGPTLSPRTSLTDPFSHTSCSPPPSLPHPFLPTLSIKHPPSSAIIPHPLFRTLATPPSLAHEHVDPCPHYPPTPTDHQSSSSWHLLWRQHPAYNRCSAQPTRRTTPPTPPPPPPLEVLPPSKSPPPPPLSAAKGRPKASPQRRPRAQRHWTTRPIRIRTTLQRHQAPAAFY